MRWTWRRRLGVLLIALTLVGFGVHYAIFRDFYHIAIYTLQDIAFLPFDVLIVTLILHQLLERQARQELVQKLNMVIGAFFSEVGNELLGRLVQADPNADDLRSEFLPSPDWSIARFRAAAAAAKRTHIKLDLSAEQLRELREFLVGKRDFLLRLLENPSLLEHESFTDLLWAVFHLTEELEQRRDLSALPSPDLAHLSGDAGRAYGDLLAEWLRHAMHLKDMYPYLYSLLVRTNPLDPTASVEVTA